MKHNMEGPQKNWKQNYHMFQQLHSWGYAKENENINSKRYMYPNAHSSFIYDSQVVEAT